MDQQKIGTFLKQRRQERQLTQENLFLLYTSSPKGALVEIECVAVKG